MAKNIVAIVGTYRKGKVIDTAVSEILRGAREHGAKTQVIYLLDKHVEFCTNCRTCTQAQKVGRRARCVQNDDMDAILQAIDEADGLVLGAPTNFYNVNALTRRFLERLAPYVFWPWDAKKGPTYRIAQPDKDAVIVTSTACPAFLARLLIPGSRKALKIAARTMGARVIQSLHFDLITSSAQSPLSEKARRQAWQAGVRLAATGR